MGIAINKTECACVCVCVCANKMFNFLLSMTKTAQSVLHTHFTCTSISFGCGRIVCARYLCVCVFVCLCFPYAAVDERAVNSPRAHNAFHSNAFSFAKCLRDLRDACVGGKVTMQLFAVSKLYATRSRHGSSEMETVSPTKLALDEG